MCFLGDVRKQSKTKLFSKCKHHFPITPPWGICKIDYGFENCIHFLTFGWARGFFYFLTFSLVLLFSDGTFFIQKSTSTSLLVCTVIAMGLRTLTHSEFRAPICEIRKSTRIQNGLENRTLLEAAGFLVIFSDFPDIRWSWKMRPEWNPKQSENPK